MTLHHVVESQQFTVPLLMELFDRTRGMERVVARGGTLDYQDRIMATLFYQPSTRTRFSFEAAMHRLGGQVLSSDHARVFSSEIEGEQVEDSIRIIGSYADVIVIRHHEVGGAKRAAQVSPVPVINAGDGNGGQHPTQALLDLYTIYRERPLDGLSIAFIGDLERGRTARSLAYLLAKFDRVKIFFVAPPELQMKPDILQYLDRHGVCFELSARHRQGRRRGERRLPDPDPAAAGRRCQRAQALRHRLLRAAADEGRRHDPPPAAAHGRARQARWTAIPGRSTSGRRPTGSSCGWRC